MRVSLSIRSVLIMVLFAPAVTNLGFAGGILAACTSSEFPDSRGRFPSQSRL